MPFTKKFTLRNYLKIEKTHDKLWLADRAQDLFDTGSRRLIFWVDEIQNKKAEGRPSPTLNTLGLARRSPADVRGQGLARRHDSERRRSRRGLGVRAQAAKTCVGAARAGRVGGRYAVHARLVAVEGEHKIG